MTPVSGINANTSLYSILAASTTANITDALLSSDSSVTTFGLFNTTSTIVDLSAEGQLLSSVSAFQNQLQSLQPGTATSGGGRNFGTDFASLAAEAQNFVDAFNALQRNIANLSNTSVLMGTNITGAADLIQSLNTQAQASFANGDSALTSLSQLGIEFQQSPIPDQGGNLSINLSALQSAFNTRPADAFSLLSTAANAFADLAANQSVSIATQAQSSALVELLTNDLLSQAQNNGDLSSLLAIESLTGVTNLQQVLLAISEFNFVSGLAH